MKTLFRILATISVVGLGWSNSASADPITINYTGDNVAIAGICTQAGCAGGFVNPLFNGPNSGDWTQIDSFTIDLAPGTYEIVFQVDNIGTGGAGNPAGLLAELLWQGSVLSSSTAWDVSTDLANWDVATSYGANGGANIWSSVLGGPVAGISTSAEWLWTQYNFSVEMDQRAFFRTSFTVVPEPGTLALFGIGLLAGALARRRKVVA